MVLLEPPDNHLLIRADLSRCLERTSCQSRRKEMQKGQTWNISNCRTKASELPHTIVLVVRIHRRSGVALRGFFFLLIRSWLLDGGTSIIFDNTLLLRCSFCRWSFLSLLRCLVLCLNQGNHRIWRRNGIYKHLPIND